MDFVNPFFLFIVLVYSNNLEVLKSILLEKNNSKKGDILSPGPIPN